MRLFVEIILIGLLIMLGITMSKERQKNNKESTQYEQKIDSLHKKLVILNKQNDSLLDLELVKEEKIKRLEIEKHQTEVIYKDSIDILKNTELTALVDDTNNIIVKDSSTYVLVPEKDFRKYKENEVSLRKMESICGIQQEQLKEKDNLLQLKDQRIQNYEQQKLNLEKQLINKDEIILNKDNKISKLIKDKKKIVIIGGTIVIGALLL